VMEEEITPTVETEVMEEEITPTVETEVMEEEITQPEVMEEEVRVIAPNSTEEVTPEKPQTKKLNILERLRRKILERDASTLPEKIEQPLPKIVEELEEIPVEAETEASGGEITNNEEKAIAF